MHALFLGLALAAADPLPPVAGAAAHQQWCDAVATRSFLYEQQWVGGTAGSPVWATPARALLGGTAEDNLQARYPKEWLDERLRLWERRTRYWTLQLELRGAPSPTKSP